MNTYPDFLQHYGVKRRSGRYPYGSGKSNKNSAEVKKQLTEEEKKEQIEKMRQVALNSTNPTVINKYKSALTSKELQERINRIESEKKIAAMASTKKVGLEKINDAIKMYNTANAVYNITKTPLYTDIKKALTKKLEN